MQMGLGYQPRSPALVDDPGNTILLNGVQQTANREIGVPGFQPHIVKSTSDFSRNLRGGWLADNFAFGDEDGLDQRVGKAAEARYECMD